MSRVAVTADGPVYPRPVVPARTPACHLQRPGLALGPLGTEAVLGTDRTIMVGLDHPLVRGNVRRLHVLQHETKRACLTASLLNLPPAPRAAIILLEILARRWTRPRRSSAASAP